MYNAGKDMKKFTYSFLIAIAFFILSACGKTKIESPKVTQNISPTQGVSPLPTENKVCSWVDNSEVIVKINLAPGIVADTSYEAGFVYPGKNGLEMRKARLARAACDYRVGFSKAELAIIGRGEVAAWGFTDSKRRTVEKAVVVQFDQGTPDIGNNIEVTIVD